MIKKDKTFYLINRNKRYFCYGYWQIKENKLLLNCKKSDNITDYVNVYEFIRDTILVMDIKSKNKLVLNRKVLTKKVE